MKYRQLTKEQFESLHEEFAEFLATQSINVDEWKKMKLEKTSIAEEEMNIFSDIVWNDVLNKTKYLEHFSKNTLNLFECKEEEINRIVLKINGDIDLLTKEGYEWLLKNYNKEGVDFFNATKIYKLERNLEIFDLIEKGSTISNGQLYNFFKKIIT